MSLALINDGALNGTLSDSQFRSLTLPFTPNSNGEPQEGNTIQCYQASKSTFTFVPTANGTTNLLLTVGFVRLGNMVTVTIHGDTVQFTSSTDTNKIAWQSNTTNVLPAHMRPPSEVSATAYIHNVGLATTYPTDGIFLIQPDGTIKCNTIDGDGFTPDKVGAALYIFRTSSVYYSLDAPDE